MNKNLAILSAVILVLAAGVFAFNKSDQSETSVPAPIESEAVHSDDGHAHEAGEVDHHLHDAKVTIGNKEFTAQMNSLGLMPLQGESGAVGYGVITEKGTDAIVVSATHAGVLDSELQVNADDPVWHNHIVRLGEVELCGENPGVVDISFESPGDILVNTGGLVMVNIPETFEGTHSLTNDRMSFTPGTKVQGVVQFHLLPIFSAENDLQAVCVTDIKEIPFDLI